MNLYLKYANLPKTRNKTWMALKDMKMNSKYICKVMNIQWFLAMRYESISVTHGIKKQVFLTIGEVRPRKQERVERHRLNPGISNRA